MRQRTCSISSGTQVLLLQGEQLQHAAARQARGREELAGAAAQRRLARPHGLEQAARQPNVCILRCGVQVLAGRQLRRAGAARRRGMPSDRSAA